MFLLRRFVYTAILSAAPLLAQTLVHPHFARSRPASSAFASVLVPFETPASIACIYGFVVPRVPGCPVVGTSALPSGGSGMIVIVNAYDYPPAQDDLNVFSRQFGIPECGESNPCFTTVYSAGVKPPVDALWAANAAGIVQYAHAFAPSAKIVLIEAPSASIVDTNAAIAFANRYVVENSPSGVAQMIIPFGSFETPGQLLTDELFTTPGIIYLSGNQFGMDIEYPASSPHVIGIGVTGVLRSAQGNLIAEFASTLDRGGTSAFEPRPSYQDPIAGQIGEKRGVPDVAFLGDPFHGAVIYYDSIDLGGFVGWQYSGYVGIGEAAWAARINRTGLNLPTTAAQLSLFYRHLGDTRSFRDIRLGQAFGTHAAAGWDVLTGIGVPR